MEKLDQITLIKSPDIKFFETILLDNCREYIICCDFEGLVSIREVMSSNIVCELSESFKPLNAIAIKPNMPGCVSNTQFCTGGEDGIAYHYNLEENGAATFIDFVLRSSIPIQTISYHPNGKIISCGLLNGDIRMIREDDIDQITTLSYIASVITHSYDPLGDFLASVYLDGIFMIWDTINIEKKISLNLLSLSSSIRYINNNIRIIFSRVNWCIDGSKVIIPIKNGLCCIKSRYEWSDYEILSVIEDNTYFKDVIGPTSISPCGAYLAATDEIGNFTVLSLEHSKVIYHTKLDSTVISLSWRLGPSPNDIFILESCGSLSILLNCVSSNISKNKEKRKSQFNQSSCMDRQNREESPNLSEIYYSSISKKDGSLNENVEYLKYQHKHALLAYGKIESYIYLPIKPQKSVQPGRLSIKSNTREIFLDYNLLGCIRSKMEEFKTIIEVNFHDIIRNPMKVPFYTDTDKIIAGSLDKNGVLYSCRPPDSNFFKNYENFNDHHQPHITVNSSRLIYRSFKPWTESSNWELFIDESETVLCLAMGKCFVAAVTDRRILRIFSLSGVHLAIRMLPGNPVSLTGYNSVLALVYHVCGPDLDGNQYLAYEILDVQKRCLLQSGRVSLSLSSKLVWLGFSQQGILHVADSEGILFALDKNYGGSWLPIWSSRKEGLSCDFFHVVGVTENSVCGIECDSDENLSMGVNYNPIHTYYQFHLPICSQGNNLRDSMEEKLICMQYKLNNWKWLENLNFIDDSDEPFLNLSEEEASFYKHLLIIIKHDCDFRRCSRVFDLCSLFNDKTFLENAIDKALSAGIIDLQERIEQILEKNLK